jgi:hypothetical protein
MTMTAAAARALRARVAAVAAGAPAMTMMTIVADRAAAGAVKAAGSVIPKDTPKLRVAVGKIVTIGARMR